MKYCTAMLGLLIRLSLVVLGVTWLNSSVAVSPPLPQMPPVPRAPATSPKVAHASLDKPMIRLVVLPPPRNAKLVWNYGLQSPDIVFNVYATTNYVVTNAYNILDDAGNVTGRATNVFDAWKFGIQIGTTSNQFWGGIQTTGSFRFFQVTASNTVNRLESKLAWK